jgi:vacuolar-type H+-ATPase subunit H
MSIETDRIERDLDQSRHRLNDTLEQLGRKISPGQMVDEVLGLAQGQLGSFAGKLGKQVKDNPLPTALIAVGVAWLITTQNQSRRQSVSMNHDDWSSEHRYRSIEEARWSTPRSPNESDDAYNERVHAAYAKALDIKQQAGEAIHDFMQRVGDAVEGVEKAAAKARDRIGQAFAGAGESARQAAGEAKHFVQDQGAKLGQRANEARHRAEDFYEHNPLAVGAILFGLGAAIGGTTPLSDAERRSLGGVADEATRRAADLAERGASAIQSPVH